MSFWESVKAFVSREAADAKEVSKTSETNSMLR